MTRLWLHFEIYRPYNQYALWEIKSDGDIKYVEL
jgi:hypothetical protein